MPMYSQRCHDDGYPTTSSTQSTNNGETRLESLKYPPFLEDLYPMHDDALHDSADSTDIDGPIADMYGAFSVVQCL